MSRCIGSSELGLWLAGWRPPGAWTVQRIHQYLGASLWCALGAISTNINVRTSAVKTL